MKPLVLVGLLLVANDDRAVSHVLNRVAFGARPGDVERVRAIGIDRYIDLQLHPERIPDRRIGDGYDSVPTPSPLRRRPVPTPSPDSSSFELAQEKVLRAVYGERQLQEVLTDFWFNHFNVDARKGPDRLMVAEYERDTIRPHVLGKFRDLLEATAKSPAMLFYLDNWLSADPNADRVRHGSDTGPTPVGPQRPQRQRGLNENYARELMELHTLGVDGGYTQMDVTEVARCFTGWTIDRPRENGPFRFAPRQHDPGRKVVLRHVIKAGGGESDGERVLDILASHPSTARFIATKLVRRFVSDTPPPPLVDRAARRFRDTGGDLREVMRTILTSPEFLSPDAYGAKMKTPFEFVVSALRATGADVTDALPIARALQQLGMPLYQCQPPTGYKDTADAWLNTGALVERMNFAVRLATGKLPGTSLAVDQSPDDLAVRLGGPEFQRR